MSLSRESREIEQMMRAEREGRHEPHPAAQGGGGRYVPCPACGDGRITRSMAARGYVCSDCADMLEGAY